MENTNTQSRKWIILLNNPVEHGFDREKITETLMMFSPDYYCGSDEIGESGTPHTHIFLYSRSPIRFSTIKSRFSVAHIEQAYGSVLQNRAYIEKSGKWSDSEKASTIVENSFFEYGVPDEKVENISKMSRLIENIRAGKKTTEIIDDMPNFTFAFRTYH